MKLAAIDIGSNAIRLQVTRTLTEPKDGKKPVFKKLEYVRFPLRLGHDVFTVGEISEESKVKFKKLMKAYKLLLELYEVDDYFACATSAMREARNGAKIAQEIREDIGIDIHIIDGHQEALLINDVINAYTNENTCLHIDVGGGSTELNLYVEGKKVISESFKVGSVRRLEHHDSPEIWNRMKFWVMENVRKLGGRISAIGTGGNINKIFDLADKRSGKSISLKKVKEIQAMLKSYDQKERVSVLQLNPDRADVIIPASEIYISVMEWARAEEIIVPDVGLKDGILLHLYEKNTHTLKG